jgi:hypothetical protein
VVGRLLIADILRIVSFLHPAKIDAGLCSHCRHARRIESDRGSVFWLCELSRTDERFPKYPRLPVLSCPGYQKKEMGSAKRTGT